MSPKTSGEDDSAGTKWSATASPMAGPQVPGDEREQVVLLEATARGRRVLIDALLCLALVTALFGSWAVPAALLVIMSLSGRVAEDYARERKVDPVGLSEGARSASSFWSLRRVLGFLGLMVTFGAMSYTGFTGQGLLPSLGVVGTGPEASPFLRAGAWSLPMWAAVGTVVLITRDAVKRRRRTRPGDDAEPGARPAG